MSRPSSASHQPPVPHPLSVSRQPSVHHQCLVRELSRLCLVAYSWLARSIHPTHPAIPVGAPQASLPRLCACVQVVGWLAHEVPTSLHCCCRCGWLGEQESRCSSVGGVRAWCMAWLANGGGSTTGRLKSSQVKSSPVKPNSVQPSQVKPSPSKSSSPVLYSPVQSSQVQSSPATTCPLVYTIAITAAHASARQASGQQVWTMGRVGWWRAGWRWAG